MNKSSIYRWASNWLFSTNHKNIGNLYFIFGTFSTARLAVFMRVFFFVLFLFYYQPVDIVYAFDDGTVIGDPVQEPVTGGDDNTKNKTNYFTKKNILLGLLAAAGVAVSVYYGYNWWNKPTISVQPDVGCLNTTNGCTDIVIASRADYSDNGVVFSLSGNRENLTSFYDPRLGVGEYKSVDSIVLMSSDSGAFNNPFISMVDNLPPIITSDCDGGLFKLLLAANCEAEFTRLSITYTYKLIEYFLTTKVGCNLTEEAISYLADMASSLETNGLDPTTGELAKKVLACIGEGGASNFPRLFCFLNGLLKACWFFL